MLSDVNMFFWPGPPGEGGYAAKDFVPLNENAGQTDLEAIMSNRRFCKIVEELRKLDKIAASVLVTKHLSAEIPKYMELYAAEMERLATDYKQDKLSQQKCFSGPTFVIENDPEGPQVIAGVRLKVLALVWVAGILNLSDASHQVQRVARLAIKQRDELYKDQSVHPFIKEQMLKRASLYNRQIVATGLYGMAIHTDIDDSVLKATGVQWQERKVTSYKAELTDYDLPVRSGVMQPDYSLEGQTVTFLSPLGDESFDRLLAEINIVP